MENVTITITPPTTEWCRSCGAEFHYSRGAMRSKCQKCGEEEMSHSLKPIHSDMVGCYKYQGQFNLMSNEKQWQYVFTNLPKSIYKSGRKSFVVDEEIDTDDAFDVIDELKVIYERCFYASDKKEIDLLHEFCTEEYRDEQYEKQSENRKQKLLAELYWLVK